MGVTSSEFQQSVTYKRALEGELASTIQGMDGIVAASVKLAIPEDTVFVDSKTEPTASIFVETQPNVSLDPAQVKAIVHLTSAAVDGLSADNISVVDSTGKLLSAAGVGLNGGTDKQATDYETRLQALSSQCFDRVVGPGNATVAVAADVGLESANRVEESFTNPDGNPVLTESSKEEEYEGSGAGAGAGVLGSNEEGADNAREGTFSSSDTNKTNAINKVTETREIPAGISGYAKASRWPLTKPPQVAWILTKLQLWSAPQRALKPPGTTQSMFQWFRSIPMLQPKPKPH